MAHIVASTERATQAPLTADELRARRERHRDQGAMQLYLYLVPDGVPWDQLSRHQRERLRAAFLIGASTVDVRRLQPEAE